MARSRLVRVVAGLLMCAGAGCAHTTTRAPNQDGARVASPARDGKAAVVLGPAAVGDPDVLGAWLIYGAIRAAAYDKTPPPPANPSADDYAFELEGRTAQSEGWKNRRAKGAKPYALFDRQVEIWQAGFLPELLISIYAHPGWTIPAETIKALRMDAFAKRFAGDFDNTVAVAVVPASGVKFAPVPGGDFPDPARLPLNPASCGQMRDERAAAWRRWEALAPRLGGTPLAATDSTHFAATLDRVKAEPAYLKRGVTWVAWRVGTLALLEGFCAIETKDWPRAVDMLTHAVGMMPLETMPRMELGMALNMVKRYDDALAQDRAIIEMTTDGCTVATALRHQGYTFIDMGLLDSARLAYEESLELDPSSELAQHELKVIASGLSKRKGAPKAAGEYVPPPMEKLIITKCGRAAQ